MYQDWLIILVLTSAYWETVSTTVLINHSRFTSTKTLTISMTAIMQKTINK